MTARQFSLLCLLLAVLFFSFGQQSALAQDDKPILKVAVNPIEPFVFVEEDEVTGFSISLWNNIAAEAGLEFEYIVVDDVKSLLSIVESGEVDVGIGATSITSAREETVDFSHAFFASGLQIMTGASSDNGILATMRGVFSINLLGIIGMSFLILLIVAHIAWLIERDDNPQFAGGYLKGILAAFYWTVVTASTVGYGDTVLRDKFGRLLAVTWMLLSIFLVSYFTATVTTSLTVGRLSAGINSPEDLRGMQVVTISDTTSAEYLKNHAIPYRGVDDVSSAIAALNAESADAFVYDAPVLRYLRTQAEGANLTLAPTVFQSENYGIVLPEGSALRQDINIALLKVGEDGTHDALTLRWFGE